MGSIKERTFLRLFLVFAILFTPFFTLLFYPALSLANESEYYCADVWACDENGELLPELRLPDHPCFLHYDTQCRNLRLEVQMSKHEEQLGKAEKEVEQTRRRLRRLRRNCR